MLLLVCLICGQVSEAPKSSRGNYLPLRNFSITGLSVGIGGIMFLRMVFLNEMGSNAVFIFAKENN